MKTIKLIWEIQDSGIVKINTAQNIKINTLLTYFGIQEVLNFISRYFN